MPWPVLARAGAASARLYMLSHGLTLFRLMNIIVAPAVTALLVALLFRHSGAGYFHAALGAGMTAMWGSLLGAATLSILRQRIYGTLEVVAGAPVPLGVVVAGEMCAEVLLSVAALVVSLALSTAVFGFPFLVALPAAFAVSLALGLAGLIALGLLVAPVMALSPSMPDWVNTLDYPVWVLGGLLFPVALLPGWTRPFSYALTPFWMAEALRSAARGDLPAAAAAWAWLVTLTLAYLALSAWLFRRVLDRARRTATITLQ